MSPFSLQLGRYRQKKFLALEQAWGGGTPAEQKFKCELSGCCPPGCVAIKFVLQRLLTHWILNSFVG